MKRTISLLCSLMLVFSCISVAPRAGATETGQSRAQVLVSKTVEYLEDGSMIITSVYEDVAVSRSSLYNKAGSKERVYTDENGNIVWSLTVYGEFRVVEGASVTCTSASCSVEIYDSEWECVTKYASTSGSQAVAHGEFQRKILGIVISERNVDVTLSCDPYGNLS